MEIIHLFEKLLLGQIELLDLSLKACQFYIIFLTVSYHLFVSFALGHKLINQHLHLVPLDFEWVCELRDDVILHLQDDFLCTLYNLVLQLIQLSMLILLETLHDLFTLTNFLL